jgi:PII-like signaling protein
VVKLEGEQVLLRMHLSNFARWHTAPLYEALVGRARKDHLAGATVLSGIFGYVERGRILGEHPRALQVERPMVLEFVDREEVLQRFLADVAPMLEGHGVLVTLERAHVVHYRGGEPGAAS